MMLAEDAWKCLDTPRAYEWKVAFGLWTALAAFSGFVLRGEVPIMPSGIWSVSALFIAIWCVFTFIWIRGLHLRNSFDRSLAEQYWIAAEVELGVVSDRAAKRPQFQHEGAWRNWSHLTQIVVTGIFVIMAIASMFLEGRYRSDVWFRFP